MKKHLSYILLAVFAAFSLALVSCGGGDDEPSGDQSSKERIEIDGVPYELSNSAKFVIWNEPPLGSAISLYAGKDGVWRNYTFGFVAWKGDLNDGKYYEPKVGIDISELGIDGDDYFSEMKLSLIDDDEVEYEYVSGSLVITALSKSTITLRFSNLKMSDGKGTAHTFNGTIKFALS